MPLVNKTFDQLLDFTRTTSGTFVGSNGLIQTTPASGNLLLWTQQFDDAAWSKTNTTVAANSAVAPDGTSTADTLTANASAGAGQQTFQTITNIGSGNYVYSIYVKQGSGATDSNSFLVRNQTTGVNPAVISFNYQTGVVTQTEGYGATAASVGNGWWRLSIPFTLTATIGNAIRFYAGSSGAVETPGEFFYAWGAQLEAASAATTYTRNNGGVFPPRFDYDPVTLAPKGLLIEEQRTNLVLRSEEFDNATWTNNNVTVTANSTASPDGTVDADLVIPNTTAGVAHTIYASISVSATSYSISFYAKQAGYTGARIADTATGVGARFDLANGVVFGAPSAGVTASIQSAGNGWYRCSITLTETAGTKLYGVYVEQTPGTSVYAGNGTSGIFLWGAQVEAGAFATSYIPTVASQVTRTADQTSIVAPNFAPWYNQSAGTFVFEGTVLGSTGFSWPLVASDNTAANRLAMYRSGASVAGFIATSSATQMEITSSPVVVNVPFKIAVSAQANDGNFSFNGNIGTADTSITMPIVNRLSLGASASGSAEYFNGHIRSIRYYPTRLTNAQLQALTA